MDIFRSLNFSSDVSVACLVSGGVDSMVLMDLTQKSSLKFHYPLMVVHFNFHLRGEESNRDQNFVEKECQKRGLPCSVIDLPISSGRSIQERVRLVRLEKLKELQKQFGWTHILMGHQLNDQAETILMKLMRGCGLTGLKGMSDQTSLNSSCFILRPLLEFSREDILKYASSRKISFVEDSTNQKTYYLRNYIRHRVIPQIQKKFPDYLQSIQKASYLLKVEDQHFNARTQKILDAYDESLGIPIASYLKWPQEIRFRVIKNLLIRYGFSKQVSRHHYQIIKDLLSHGGCHEKRFGDCGVLVSYGRTYFWKVTEKIPFHPLLINSPGTYEISSLKKKLILSPDIFSVALKKPLENSGTQGSKKLFLNPQKIQFPLTLRFIQPGDRFCPFGGRGSKKISDYLIDKKIPRFLRSSQMVLCQESQVICLLGHQIDDYFRVLNPPEPCLTVHISY